MTNKRLGYTNTSTLCAACNLSKLGWGVKTINRPFVQQLPLESLTNSVPTIVWSMPTQGNKICSVFPNFEEILSTAHGLFMPIYWHLNWKYDNTECLPRYNSTSPCRELYFSKATLNDRL